VSVFTSRTPASITSARAPRAWNEVAIRSPKKPSVLSVVQPATTMSPGLDLLGHHVQHPVVAGLQQHGDVRAETCAPG
jgi:hypothetical protein